MVPEGGGERNQSAPSMVHLEVQRKTPRKLKHQRSYSTGDLSPTVEKMDTSKLKPPKEKYRERSNKTADTSPSKSVTDKRKGWVKQKQKSKSFDFSWRVGSMWSPVEDRKSYRKEILLMESEPRCPRPKPPSMLELDSGSSYESRDGNFSKDVPKTDKGYNNTPNEVKRKEWKCPVLKENGKSLNSTDIQDSNQDRRRSIFGDRKSHSLDSSLEEYHSSSQEKDDKLTDASVTYQAMAARDRRLKLQDQRRSRSLDIYDPRTESHRESYHQQMQDSRPRSILKFTEEQYRNMLDDPTQHVPRSRRASDIPARSPRRQSDVIPAAQPRRSSDFVAGGSPARRTNDPVYQKRSVESSSKLSSGRRPRDNGDKSPRRASDISPGQAKTGTSPRRASEIVMIGQSPTQSLEKSGSPGKHDETRRTMDTRRAFAQQKSFSFDVSGYPITDNRHQDPSSAVRYRTKGRMLPKVPGDRKSDGTSPGRQSDKTKEKRCHFAEQKSFSYETTSYSPAPPSGRYQHRNSEPVVFDIKRRRDYIERHEVPVDISPQTKMHSPNSRESSGERRGHSVEQKGEARTSPRSPREKNMRQEAMDKNAAGRAATSPAAFSLSYGSFHQLSPSHKQSQKGLHQNVPSPQRDSSKSPRIRKNESISIGATTRHHSPSDIRRGHDSRRKKFSEQKSFSYEVATTYQPVSNDMYNEDYAEITRARTARDKRLIMMKTRASHSLDDIDFQKQMAYAQGQYGTANYDPNYRHLPPPLGYMYMGQHHLVPREQNQARLSPTRYESHRGASRSPSRSPDRNRDRDVSPRSSASRAKMMMLHSMKAVAHEGGGQAEERSPRIIDAHHGQYQHDPPQRRQTRDKATQQDHNGQLYDYEQGLYEDPRYLPPTNFQIGDQLFDVQPTLLPHFQQSDNIDASEKSENRKSKESQEEKPKEESDFESKPVLSGPQPAVLIKPLPRDMLRKDRYSDGKPFWKFWKS